MYNKLIKQDFCEFYIVFQDEVSLWWLRVLKPGFRHCYLLIPLDGNAYFELNPMSNRLFINRYNFAAGYDYLAALQSGGKRILKVAISRNPPLAAAPLAFFTCVEFIKKALGIHDRFIITPYALYKKLKVVGKSS